MYLGSQVGKQPRYLWLVCWAITQLSQPFAKALSETWSLNPEGAVPTAQGRKHPGGFIECTKVQLVDPVPNSDTGRAHTSVLKHACSGGAGGGMEQQDVMSPRVGSDTEAVSAAVSLSAVPSCGQVWHSNLLPTCEGFFTAISLHLSIHTDLHATCSSTATSMHFFIPSNPCPSLGVCPCGAQSSHGPGRPWHSVQQPLAPLLTRDCPEEQSCPFCCFVGMSPASLHNLLSSCSLHLCLPRPPCAAGHLQQQSDP